MNDDQRFIVSNIALVCIGLVALVCDTIVLCVTGQTPPGLLAIAATAIGGIAGAAQFRSFSPYRDYKEQDIERNVKS